MDHRRVVLILTLVVALAACDAGEQRQAAEPASRAKADPEESPAQERGARRRDRVPDARQKIPAEPQRLADDLRSAYRNLTKDIERWRAGGTKMSSPLARRVSLQALLQQRIYRRLVASPRLVRRVKTRLRPSLARVVEANVRAGAKLHRLVVRRDEPVKLRVAQPEPPDRLRRFYERAQQRYDIPWHVLAAVNFVESHFGRVLGPSTAGALGPMQFLPSTWDAYGRGDIMDPRDSILGAARYLSASGAPERMRDALFAYNRSNAYVDAILTYARQIKRDVRNYYSYYFWQVFVATKKGDVQLTGPGAPPRARRFKR